MGSFWFGSRECRVKRKGALVTRIEVTFSMELTVRDVRFTKHMSDQDILTLFSLKNPLDTTVFSGPLRADSWC